MIPIKDNQGASLPNTQEKNHLMHKPVRTPSSLFLTHKLKKKKKSSMFGWRKNQNLKF